MNTFTVRIAASGHAFARVEMRFCKAEAFILKIYPFSESSLVIHTLARDHGRLHLLARGARRGKTRALAGLEPFCRVEISYVEKEGRDLQSLRESTLLEGNGAFRTKLGLWAAGSMFFELIDRATGGDDAAGGLFDLGRVFVDRAISLAEADTDLKGKGGNEKNAAADIDALLPYCFAVFGCLGVAPLVGKCARCGETKGQFPLLDPEKGGVLCAACVEAGAESALSPRSLPIDEGVRRILLRWLIEKPPLLRSGRPQIHTGGDVRLLRGQREKLLKLLERLTAEHLEAPLKSLEVVRGLLKS